MAEKTFNWFPGHMLKGKRIISENLSRVDALVELVDSRVPLTSLNHDLCTSMNNSPRRPIRILVLNKCDLADNGLTSAWVKLFRKAGLSAISVDSLTGTSGVNKLIQELDRVHRQKMETARRGAITSTLHVMVVGLPNVGKSSLINRLASRRSQEQGPAQRKTRGKAKTGATPGVTRGGQWVKIAKGLEVLDTPGVLFPRMDSLAQGLKLAIIAAITDRVLDEEKVAEALLLFLAAQRPGFLTEKFGLAIPENLEFSWDHEGSTAAGATLLSDLSVRLGKINRGGDIDTLSGARILLTEFRKGSLGRMTLERPEEFTQEFLNELVAAK